MEKTGELKEGTSRCDYCGAPATDITGKKAVCDDHKGLGEKAASAEEKSLKAFTEPLTADG